MIFFPPKRYFAPESKRNEKTEIENTVPQLAAHGKLIIIQNRQCRPCCHQIIDCQAVSAKLNQIIINQKQNEKKNIAASQRQRNPLCDQQKYRIDKNNEQSIEQKYPPPKDFPYYEPAALSVETASAAPSKHTITQQGRKHTTFLTVGGQ